MIFNKEELQYLRGLNQSLNQTDKKDAFERLLDLLIKLENKVDHNYRISQVGNKRLRGPYDAGN